MYEQEALKVIRKRRRGIIRATRALEASDLTEWEENRIGAVLSSFPEEKNLVDMAEEQIAQALAFLERASLYLRLETRIVKGGIR